MTADRCWPDVWLVILTRFNGRLAVNADDGVSFFVGGWRIADGCVVYVEYVYSMVP